MNTFGDEGLRACLEPCLSSENVKIHQYVENAVFLSRV